MPDLTHKKAALSYHKRLNFNLSSTRSSVEALGHNEDSHYETTHEKKQTTKTD